MSEFLHMGGYASYVWSSYGLAFLVLIPTLLLPLREHKQLINKLKGRYRREAVQKAEKLKQKQDQI